MNALSHTTKLIVDGQEKVRIEKHFVLSADFTLDNVRQVGPFIEAYIGLHVDVGIGRVDAEFGPISLDTGLGNPIYVTAGILSIPFFGDVEVLVEFSYDLVQRQLCAAITLAGLITLGKKCVNW